jgi:hypothetical protein
MGRVRSKTWDKEEERHNDDGDWQYARGDGEIESRHFEVQYGCEVYSVKIARPFIYTRYLGAPQRNLLWSTIFWAIIMDAGTFYDVAFAD